MAIVRAALEQPLLAQSGRSSNFPRSIRVMFGAAIWMRLFEAVSNDPDMEYAMVDATIVKVHRHGQGAKGGPKARPSAVQKAA